MQDIESDSANLSNFLDEEKLIAEWVIDADNLYSETCEDCGWTTEAKDSHDSAVRALRAHQARYCPILFDTEQPALTQ